MLCIDNSTCTGCALCSTRHLVVNGKGDPSSRIWIIGLNPGTEEDACGIPFVGRAGKRLSQLLGEDIEKDVYIVNLVRCKTPENREPTTKEIKACVPFLQLEILEHRPEILVLLGGTVASFFFNKDVSVMKYRGDYFYDIDLEIPLIVTFHPAFLVRHGHKFDQAFLDDLQMALEYTED